MSNSTIHTEELGCFKIEVWQDYDAPNPVTDWDLGANIVLNYGSNIQRTHEAWVQQTPAYKYKFDSAQEALNMLTGRDEWEEDVCDEEADEYKPNPEQPTPPTDVIFVMTGQYRQHGGIMWSEYTPDQLKNIDSDDIERAEAVLWLTNDDQAREGWKKPEDAVAYCKALANELDDYLSGNVYGFTIYNDQGEIFESCGGFIGDYDDEKHGALKGARSIVAAQIKREKQAASFEARFFHT